MGDVAVRNKVGGLRAGHLDGGAQDNTGEAHAAHGGPEEAAVGVVGGTFRLQVEYAAVSNQQFHTANVVAEGAGGVVVLAVDVGANSAADSHLASAGEDRDPKAVGQGCFHQLVEGNTSIHVSQGRIWVDAVDSVEGFHVDDEATGVGGRVPVGAAAAAGDDAAFQVAGLGLVIFGNHTDSTDDLFRVAGREHLGSGGLGASPAGQGFCLGVQVIWGV